MSPELVTPEVSLAAHQQSGHGDRESGGPGDGDSHEPDNDNMS